MDAETRQALDDMSLRLGNLGQMVRAGFNDLQAQMNDLARAVKIGFDDVQEKIRHLTDLYQVTAADIVAARLRQDRIEKRFARLEKKT